MKKTYPIVAEKRAFAKDFFGVPQVQGGNTALKFKEWILDDWDHPRL